MTVAGDTHTGTEPLETIVQRQRPEFSQPATPPPPVTQTARCYDLVIIDESTGEPPEAVVVGHGELIGNVVQALGDAVLDSGTMASRHYVRVAWEESFLAGMGLPPENVRRYRDMFAEEGVGFDDLRDAEHRTAAFNRIMVLLDDPQAPSRLHLDAQEGFKLYSKLAAEHQVGLVLYDMPTQCALVFGVDRDGCLLSHHLVRNGFDVPKKGNISFGDQRIPYAAVVQVSIGELRATLDIPLGMIFDEDVLADVRGVYRLLQLRSENPEFGSLVERYLARYPDHFEAAGQTGIPGLKVSTSRPGLPAITPNPTVGHRSKLPEIPPPVDGEPTSSYYMAVTSRMTLPIGIVVYDTNSRGAYVFGKGAYTVLETCLLQSGFAIPVVPDDEYYEQEPPYRGLLSFAELGQIPWAFVGNTTSDQLQELLSLHPAQVFSHDFSEEELGFRGIRTDEQRFERLAMHYIEALPDAVRTFTP